MLGQHGLRRGPASRIVRVSEGMLYRCRRCAAEDTPCGRTEAVKLAVDQQAGLNLRGKSVKWSCRWSWTRACDSRLKTHDSHCFTRALSSSNQLSTTTSGASKIAAGVSLRAMMKRPS